MTERERELLEYADPEFKRRCLNRYRLNGYPVLGRRDFNELQRREYECRGQLLYTVTYVMRNL